MAFVGSVSGQYLVPATFLSGTLTSHLADISNIQASITIQPPPFSVREWPFSRSTESGTAIHCFVSGDFCNPGTNFCYFSPLTSWMDVITIFDCQLQVKPDTLSPWLQHLCALLWLTLGKHLSSCVPIIQCKVSGTFSGTRFLQQLQLVYPRSALPSTWSTLYPPNNILHISQHHFLLVLIVNLDRCSDQ